MKVLKTVWFAQNGSSYPIGIVMGVGDVGEKKAYIGTAVGHDKEQDVKHIAQNGAKLTEEMCSDLFGFFKV